MLLVVLLITCSSAFIAKNTTKFWEGKLNTTLHFTSYSGNPPLTQAIKKLIGTIPRARQACSTTSSAQPATMSTLPPKMCPS